MRSATTVLSLSALVLAGCSTTPLPEDFSGKSTYTIVKKIRCEVREAIQQKAIALMTGEGAPPQTRAEGFRLKNGEVRFLNYDYKKLDPKVAAYFDFYARSAIALDFLFDITEENNNKSTVNFAVPINSESLTVGLTGGGKVTRSNVRSLRTTDYFGDLALKLTDDYCGTSAEDKNVVYPIVGKIGIAERIDTFIDLNESGQLGIPKDATVPTMVDTLKFTTVMSLNATPKLTIKSAGSRVSDATFGSENSRTDQHSVKIAISLPPPPAPPAKAGAPAPKVAKGAKENAENALDRQYVIDGLILFSDIKKRLELQQ